MVDELWCEAGLDESLQSNCISFVLKEVIATMPYLPLKRCLHYSKLAY